MANAGARRRKSRRVKWRADENPKQRSTRKSLTWRRPVRNLRASSSSRSRSHQKFNSRISTFPHFMFHRSVHFTISKAKPFSQFRATTVWVRGRFSCVGGRNSSTASNSIEPPSDLKCDSAKRWRCWSIWIAPNMKCESRDVWKTFEKFKILFFFQDSNDHTNPASLRVAPARQSSARSTASITSWWRTDSNIS